MRPRTSDEGSEGSLQLCVDCDADGAENPHWFLRDQEAQWFIDRSMNIPKRCPKHRALKRERNARTGLLRQ